MKKGLCFIVMTVLFLQFGFAAGGKENAKNQYKIGVAVYGLKGEYMRLWATALERHPAVTSGRVKITVFNGNYDASVQQSQFENMITQSFDAILFIQTIFHDDKRINVFIVPVFYGQKRI